ncbi:MAG TPA: hypothetical protein VMR45_01200 [Patescibacteria group bacterium]|jgi:hypothetical protein|nr:hypothetical protein [Patescibacteria group bacterium]
MISNGLLGVTPPEWNLRSGYDRLRQPMRQTSSISLGNNSTAHRCLHTLAIFLFTTLAIFGFPAFTGNISIDASSGQMGLYASSHQGLPSYYNPLFDTLRFIETLSLIIFPIVLLFVRRYINVSNIMPWTITSILIILSNFLIRWPQIFSNHDSTIESSLPYLLREQLIVVMAIMIGFAINSFLKKKAMHTEIA